MKYAIITPTFEPHFKYIEKYLESYNKYVIDKNDADIQIIFTISKSEKKSFKKITDKYIGKINFKALFFEDILKSYGIKETPDLLLTKYKKFSFQTLKKFYTMLYSDADYFLVLDSESEWIKETTMKNLFEEFFINPFLSVSNIQNRDFIDNFTKGVINNTNYILKKSNNLWFLENFVWFYDKNILRDMFKELGTPIEIVQKIYDTGKTGKIESGVFEIELYQAYIYENNYNYNYKIIDIDGNLNKILPEKELLKYKTKYYKKFIGNCGLLEHSSILLTDNNVLLLAKIFKDNNFNIIRCEYSDISNYKLQKQFFDIVQPNILAASQEHAFGINNKYFILFKNDRFFCRLKKHFKLFISPIKAFFYWISEGLSIIWYSVLFLFNLLKIIFECIRTAKNDK